MACKTRMVSRISQLDIPTRDSEWKGEQEDKGQGVLFLAFQVSWMPIRDSLDC